MKYRITRTHAKKVGNDLYKRGEVYDEKDIEDLQLKLTGDQLDMPPLVEPYSEPKKKVVKKVVKKEAKQPAKRKTK